MVLVVLVRTFSLCDVSVHATWEYAPYSGGRSPGTQTPGDPATPSPRRRRTPKNSSAQCPDGEQVTAKNKGLMKIMSRLRQIRQPKYRLCDFSVLSQQKSKGTQGEVHRNQQTSKHIPQPRSTTSAAPLTGEQDRIDFRSRVPQTRGKNNKGPQSRRRTCIHCRTKQSAKEEHHHHANSAYNWNVQNSDRELVWGKTRK